MTGKRGWASLAPLLICTWGSKSTHQWYTGGSLWWKRAGLWRQCWIWGNKLSKRISWCHCHVSSFPLLCDSLELPWLAKFDTHLTHLAPLHWERRSEIWQGPATEWSLDFECQASWPMPQTPVWWKANTAWIASVFVMGNGWKWMEMVHPKLTVQSWSYLATLNFQVQRRLCQGKERSWTQIVWHPKHGAEVT